MAADAQTILDNINAIYTSELGRQSDPGGAEFYAGLARGGTSLEDIRAQISGSAEGRAYDQAAINNIYQSELGRAADTGGMEYYTNLLNQGVTPDEVRRQINVSDEGRLFDRTMAANIMSNQLGRIDPASDPEGLNFYTNLLQQGTPIENIIGQINRSPEGKAYDLKTLQNAYQTAFKRPLDTEGQNYWLNRMQEDPNINDRTLMDFLKGGAKGVDIPGAGTTITATPGTGTTTTNVVPSGTVTTPRFDTTMANQVIPQTIGPGAGAIESQIRQGVLPQQVVIGGAPVNISGGYGAYPYGIESLAQTFGTPAAKLRSVASTTPSTIVAAPRPGGTNVPSLYDTAITPFSSIAAPTMTTPARTGDFYTNPYSGPYAPSPYKSMYGPIAGPSGVAVTVPSPILGATSSPTAPPNVAAATPIA